MQELLRRGTCLAAAFLILGMPPLQQPCCQTADSTPSSTPGAPSSLADFFKEVRQKTKPSPEDQQTRPLFQSQMAGETGNKWNNYYMSANNPERDQDPKTLKALEWLDPQPGMTVAEIHARGGYMAFRFSPLVEPEGCVIATEMDPELVEYISEVARAWEFANITPLLAGWKFFGMEPGSVDRLLMLNAGFFREGTDELNHHNLDQIGRTLRPNGKVVIIQGYCASDACAGMLKAGEVSLPLDRLKNLFSKDFLVRQTLSLSMETGDGKQWDQMGFLLAEKPGIDK